MRVTINFDVEAGRARSAMKALVLAESDYISQALVKLASVNSQNVSGVASEVSEILKGVSVQLGQYARMVSDLDQLSNKTILPTPVEDVNTEVTGNDEEVSEELKNTLETLRGQVDEIKQFANFMEKASKDEYEEG
jgi:hypothetical protein